MNLDNLSIFANHTFAKSGFTVHVVAGKLLPLRCRCMCSRHSFLRDTNDAYKKYAFKLNTVKSFTTLYENYRSASLPGQMFWKP